MSEETRGELTLGQQRFMERMQEAQNEGVSLPDYYRAHGLSMAMLYKVRRQLVQKGIVPPTRQQEQMVSGPDKFVQVRVQESLGRSGAGGPRSGMPAAPSERVADRVRDVAGAAVAVAADGRAAMMRPYGEGLKVYLYREPVDMRKWRNGLAALAQEVMKVDPFSGALLIFVGKYYNAVKILYWHRNGFAVWHKVIEGREKFCWPRLMEQEVVTLTAEELEWLLDGYDIFRQPHKMLRFKHAA